MYWNRECETMSRDELSALQLERLQKTAKKVYDIVPFYRKAFEGKGITPEDIQSLDVLSKLPFTVKTDLRDNYPYGLFAVPQEQIVRLHASSGTTGKPIVVGYTHQDIAVWAEVFARSLAMVGCTSEDTIHVSYGYGLFTGGFGAHYGAELLGATVVPVSGGNTDRQLMLMEDFSSTVLACTPSYALYLGEAGAKRGIDFTKLPLKVGIFGAEPWSEQMREQLEQRLAISAYDIYGLTEVIGPGVAMECPYKQGLHINEDHFIAEIIDPDTGENLPYGMPGELVLTTITKEAFPVIRYRTRDITVLNPEPCACGRTHIRMQRISGRTDDMLIIRGVNIFPTQIESVLLEFGETEPHYLLVVDRKGSLDDMEIWVEMSPELFNDKVSHLEETERRIFARMHSVLGISVPIKLVEPHTIPRTDGKAKRIVDRREI